MKGSQFTIREMFLAVTLLAAGVASLAWLSNQTVRGPNSPPMPLVITLWFAGPTCIGAGACLPFRMGVVGAVIGFLAQVAFTLFFVAGNC